MRAERVRVHATEVGRRLLFADDPDPRVLQGVFFALLSLDYLLRSVDGTPIGLRSWPALGYALALVLTVATFVVPWRRLPRVAIGIVPVLDIAALSLARLDERGSAAAALIIIPALWLARLYGRRGAIVVVRRRPGADRHPLGPLPRHRRGEPVALADGPVHRRLGRSRPRQRAREDRGGVRRCHQAARPSLRWPCTRSTSSAGSPRRSWTPSTWASCCWTTPVPTGP